MARYAHRVLLGTVYQKKCDMKSITSRENPLFKSLKKLESSAKDRKVEAKTLLDGEHLIEAYLSSGGIPELIVLNDFAANGAAPDALLKQIAPERLVVMPDALLRELSPVKTPTGMIALIAIPSTINETSQADFCVMLEDIQDPGNLGSILRSAAGAGVQRVYLSSKCADAWSPKVLRAGMGAHFCLEIQENAELIKIADKLAGSIIATCLNANKSLFDLDLTGPVTFLVGNEGAGLSAQLEDVATEKVSIPMPGKIESLNAASAASICFFERVRQIITRS